jgi:hypothetical protein
MHADGDNVCDVTVSWAAESTMERVPSSDLAIIALVLVVGMAFVIICVTSAGARMQTLLLPAFKTSLV